MLGRTILLVGGAAIAFAVAGPYVGQQVEGLVAQNHAPHDPAAADDAAAGATGAPASPRAGLVTAGAVILPRDGDSHFRAVMLVNGRPVRMLVDTGASVVVLRESDARNAGLVVDPAAFTGRAMTAGGPVKVARVVIDRLAIGAIERRTIEAAVMQGDALPESLLGQSFLNQLAEVRTAGGQMQLR